MADFRFQILKFDGVVGIHMTVEMADELLERLARFDDLKTQPHLFAFRNYLRDVVRTSKKSLIPNVQKFANLDQRRGDNGVDVDDHDPKDEWDGEDSDLEDDVDVDDYERPSPL